MPGFIAGTFAAKSCTGAATGCPQAVAITLGLGAFIASTWDILEQAREPIPG